MFDRTSTHLDLPSIPIPESGLIGFQGHAKEETCYPVYRVTQEEWDDLPDFWVRRKSMKRLERIRNELKELRHSLQEIAADTKSHTPACCDAATKAAAKLFEAMAICDEKDAEWNS